MLETDEVDDDYFTPVSSAPLASIFSSSSETKNVAANDSLKYTPPKKEKQQKLEPNPEDETRLTECVFACALTAYEWATNNYSTKGKVGFAIVKVVKTDCHNLILYNSHKTTLSTTTVSPNFTVTIKGNNFICYYDNSLKYWSIYMKQEEKDKIVDILKSLDVKLQYATNEDKNPPEPSDQGAANVVKEIYKTDKESDTDSSINKRTKASILNRMASMGHSVLPPHNMPAHKSSDSSDTSEIENQPLKTTKHKLVKPNGKRTSMEKNCQDFESTHLSIQKIEQNVHPATIFTMLNGQLVPMPNSGVVPNYSPSSNDMGLFMTEQRINNNELRMNINRTTDKVDQVLEKLSMIDSSEKNRTNSDFQITLMQKLLVEYENKIKLYEEMLGCKNVNSIVGPSSNTSVVLESERTELFKNQILELEQIIAEKNKEISKSNEILEENSKLKQEKQELELQLEKMTLKENEFVKNVKELQTSQPHQHTNNNLENKLKCIMNDVFQSVALHFDDSEVYSGEMIKTTVGKIVKKMTIKSLKDNF